MDFGTPSSAGNESCIETVRALHQTILALKTALEKSRSEILELKTQNWSIDNAVGDTIKNLSIENHILRQKVVNEAEDSEKIRKESKQKKVKRKSSNEKIFVKKEWQETECNRGVLSEKNKSRNVYKSLENISTANIQRKVNKTQNQLTKSKTIYFSNVFEGENQISTTNSLHIKAPKTQKVKVSKEYKDNSKYENKDVKPYKDFNFKEETINDNFTASRRGSITDFETEGHISLCKDLKQSKKYSEYVKKSEQLIKSPHKIQNKGTDDRKTIKCKKTSAVGKSNIIDNKQLRKREETFIKKQVENRNNGQENSLIHTQETRRKSSILGEDIEKALTQQYPAQLPANVNLKEIEKLQSSGKESELNNIFSNLQVKPKKCDRKSEKDQLKVTNIKLDQIQSNKSGELSEKIIIKTIENQISNQSGVEIKDSGDLENANKENFVCAGNELDRDIYEIKGGLETIEKGGNEDDSWAEPSDSQVKASETHITQEEKPQHSKETVENPESDKRQNSDGFNEINPGKGTNIDGTETNENPEKNRSENSSEVTINSSEPSTNSLTSQKNVEISVKIYKGSKKPIEIDIQTKKKSHKSKRTNKYKKMDNKSQNTSFDKEYGDSPSNPASTNEIRRHVESATANNIVTNILQNDVEQEVDDIELIFTTDDTKDTDFKEELVPIDTYTETQLLQCPLSDYEEKLSAETSDRELEDDVFNDNFENENQENCNFQSQTYDFRRENSQIYNSKSDNSINHEDKSLKSYYSYQDSSFENKSLEKDESFDRFEEKSRIIETDISKIGIQDLEYNMGRRNTCPNPIQYKPIMHREALGRGISSSRKCRPILAHSNVVRKESGAQTDISALPGSSWRSESSLGHKVKVGDNFTTLPSKFPHPGSRLRLSEKTVEARRVLLSDIGFTSMVPELSRSADHLCPPVVRGPVVSSYGQFLRTTDLYSPAYTSQKFVWTTTTPSEGSHSQSRYSSQYPLSPPVPTRRCSAPVSPSKKAAMLKNTPSKVRFANGSLPELRGDWTATVDSGESTDSLVEEAEHFLRRSIDCLAPCKDICFRSETAKMSGVRRASAPEPTRDNVPPQGWQPFLPRIPRDLHLDYWVKVISPEGRVRGGRVRYVGPLMNHSEAFVGVQLSTPDGHSDGTYSSRRYFNCEPYHGLFVPFKKIIMGWRP